MVYYGRPCWKQGQGFNLTFDAGTRQEKAAERREPPKEYFFMGIAPRVKPDYPTGKVFQHRPQGGFFMPGGIVNHEEEPHQF